MSDKKKVWIYDLEQLQNCHTATFLNRDDPKEIKVFVIHYLRNDIIEYMTFLNDEVAGLIGFNSLRYDYPLLHYLMVISKFENDPVTITRLL